MAPVFFEHLCIHAVYVIEDGHTFFESQAYDKHTWNVINKDPSLFIFNNMLNVLEAKTGWDILQAAWKKLRVEDYLIISGLVPEQLEKYGLNKRHEIDGIVEFHHSSKGFYKSALSSDFCKYIENNLKGSGVLFDETFEFSIESQIPKKIIAINGHHLLTLKKTKEVNVHLPATETGEHSPQG